MINISQAKIIVPRSNNQNQILNKEGYTPDIIHAMLDIYPKSKSQVKALAQKLKGNTPIDSARNIWNFIKMNIRYQLDPPGKQLIKEPRRIISDGFSDCKGYSILANSLLSALGIQNKFRFVSYRPGPVTHVYSVALIDNKEIIIDACMTAFDQQKAYLTKKDYMTEISHLSGLPDVNYVGETAEHIIAGLRIQRDLVATEAELLAERGISGPALSAYDEAVNDYNQAIAAAEAGNYDAVESIGDAIGRRRGGGNRKARRGGFIKKVGKKLKKLGAKGLKIVQRFNPYTIAARGGLELLLPKAGPALIYIFITNPKTLQSLPANVARKRKKAVNIVRFISKVTTMKEAHILKLLRKGVMKRYKRTPEEVLSGWLNQPITGLGYVDPATAAMATQSAAGAAGSVIDLLEKIVKLFKKKGQSFSADDSPSPDDFADASPRQKRVITANMRYKTKAERGEEPGTDTEEMDEQQAQDEAVDQADRSEDNPESTSNEESTGNDDSENFNMASRSPKPAKQLNAEAKTYSGTNISINNALPWLIGGGAALFLLSGKKR